MFGVFDLVFFRLLGGLCLVDLWVVFGVCLWVLCCACCRGCLFLRVCVLGALVVFVGLLVCFLMLIGGWFGLFVSWYLGLIHMTGLLVVYLCRLRWLAFGVGLPLVI